MGNFIRKRFEHKPTQQQHTAAAATMNSTIKLRQTRVVSKSNTTRTRVVTMAKRSAKKVTKTSGGDGPLGNLDIGGFFAPDTYYDGAKSSKAKSKEGPWDTEAAVRKEVRLMWTPRERGRGSEGSCTSLLTSMVETSTSTLLSGPQRPDSQVLTSTSQVYWDLQSGLLDSLACLLSEVSPSTAPLLSVKATAAFAHQPHTRRISCELDVR